MKTRFFGIIFGFLFVANVTFGWTWPEVSIRSVFGTQFLDPGTGYVIYDKPVIQSDLEIGLPFGFRMNVLNSKSLNDGGWGETLGDEMDYTLGWRGAIIKNFGLDVSVTFLDELHLFQMGEDDIFYSRFHFSYTHNEWRFSGIWENYATFSSGHLTGGDLVGIGVSKEFALVGEWMVLETETATLYNTGALHREDFFQRGMVSLGLEITEGLTVIAPRIDFYVPFQHGRHQENDAVVFMGLKYRF
jgi:hypothetical protein